MEYACNFSLVTKYIGFILKNEPGESVYNICLIGIDDTVSDRVTKTLVLNTERSWYE